MLLLSIPLFFIACLDDEECNPEKNNSGTLIIPELYATLPANDPMTGALSVYPCRENSSIYFGNYNRSGELLAIHAFYITQNGTANSGSSPVRLPIGTYNMVYWGLPQATTPQYVPSAVQDPPVQIGDDLSTLQLKLRKYENINDTTYYPTHDYALAVAPVNIGTEQLHAALKRKSAAIDVIVQNKNNASLAENIDSMWVHLGGIADGINFYTGVPSNIFRTVEFGLEANEDNTKRISKTVMVFPSSPSPLFQLFILLDNQQTKVYKLNLSKTLTAGTKLTLTLTLNEIISEENKVGEFTVDNWTEYSESVVIPPFF